MRTSKPIATISYNTVDFLDRKLAELIRNHRIQDYFYILHHAEEDEKKDHIHLYLEPNTRLDTMEIQEFLEEPDPKYPKKPLRPLPFKFCRNLDEWILYVEHFPPYLASKFEERRFVYDYGDFRFYNEDSFFDAWLHAHKGSEWAHRNSLLEQLRNPYVQGLDLILNGSVPLNMSTQIAAIERMQTDSLIAKEHERQGIVNRNGKKSHTPKDDGTKVEKPES